APAGAVEIKPELTISMSFLRNEEKKLMSTAFQPSPLFERVERARRRKHKIRDAHITLAHGSGGRAMHELIEGLFLDYLRNPLLEQLEDQAVFQIESSHHPLAGLANIGQATAR